ncbi:ABC transporter permease, partial [Leptospira santarosai]|nr:ABC transporter permease [Leptospira santarosai]
EKPWTKVDYDHVNNGQPGVLDLYAPYGSGITVMKADGDKFKVTELKSLSEGGNSLRLKFNLGGVERTVDVRHAQNQFPSYVIDQLKANPRQALTFDTGTVVGWTGVTGQHGIGNEGKVKWDPTDHAHVDFNDKTKWKDWALQSMGY